MLDEETRKQLETQRSQGNYDYRPDLDPVMDYVATMTDVLTSTGPANQTDVNGPSELKEHLNANEWLGGGQASPL